MMQISITTDRSFHLSLSQPVPRTQMIPIAPLGALRIKASRELYPNVVNRMLEKLEIPPFGIELRIVARQTR